jgi:hypothetical protein
MAALAQQRSPCPSTVEEAPSERSPSVAGDSDSGMSQALSELSLAGSQTRSVWGLFRVLGTGVRNESGPDRAVAGGVPDQVSLEFL